MANFSSLKQSIQNYIKENGNKEITGNLLQEILLSMVVTMGDNAINGVLQSLSNEMISRENADGLLNQALTAEQQRAIAAETKSAVLDGETNTLVFKNAAGQELYHVSVASLIANGLVDVEVDGTNLVMTFHTESGDEEITIPISDIFNPSNYYTKTQVNSLLSPITTAITNVSSRLNNGYIYLGVAGPETIPTSATGKFFYIASQAGTYHFMSNGDIPIVISSNGLYILSGGVEADDWYLETIVTFTNNVQFNNAQPITSGGVFNAILPINDLLRRNYMLAGVADTTTTPTEDTNVFYLAGQGGTYSHFLNGDDDPLVLPKGLTVIYRGVEDDGWNYWVVYSDNDFINTNRAQALTSDQQTEAQNNMMAKSYAPAQFSGLGKKILAKNIQQVSGVQKNVMTQAFFQDEQGNDLENTVFVIQYDYTLGENITVPANCVLKFDGGSISADVGENKDTITGANTGINAGLVKIFNTNVIFAGSWNVAEAYPEWFGAKGDGVTDDVTAVQNCIDFCYSINAITKLSTKTYNVSKPIVVFGSEQRINQTRFFGSGRGNTIICKTTNTRTDFSIAEENCILLILNEYYKTNKTSLEVKTASNVVLKGFSLTSTDNLAYQGVHGPCVSSCLFEDIDIKHCAVGFEFRYNLYLTQFKTIKIHEAEYGFTCSRVGIGSAANTTIHFEDCHTLGTKVVDYYINGNCTLVNCAKDGFGHLTPPRLSTFIKTNGVEDFKPICRSRFLLESCHIESIDESPAFDLRATTMVINGGVIEMPFRTIFKIADDSQVVANGVTFWDYEDDNMFPGSGDRIPVLHNLNNASTIHYNECYIQECLYSQAPVLKNKNKYLYNKYINEITIKNNTGITNLITATDMGDYIDYDIKTGVDKSVHLYLGENLHFDYNRLKMVLEAEIPGVVDIVYRASDEVDNDGYPVNPVDVNIAYKANSPYFNYEAISLGNGGSGDNATHVATVNKRTLIGCNLLEKRYHFIRIYLSLNDEFHIKMYKVELD